MTPPPEQLEQTLEAHGDALYRVAVVMVGDEGGAARLLRDLAAALGQPGAPAAPLDEPALVALLVAAARAAAEGEARGGPARRPRRERANLFAPFALHHLTLDQRTAVALHLLLGYDGQRLAAALGGDLAGARAALVAGVRSLAPAAGASLTDRVSGEQCDQVRAVLADPAAGSRSGAAVRGHLAGCAPCRSFDHAWGATLTAVEEALRGALRGLALPAALRSRLLALAAPGRGRREPAWRLTRVALAPLGVLALILAIALPGFLRQTVSVVDHQPGAPVDAQALIARSLARHRAPPGTRSGVWYGRYETLWYFGDDVVAPLRAEAWLDPRAPARHRLQITHRDGGAPYELQIGDGSGRLSYALDAAYAPALYGRLQTTARISEPALVTQPLGPEGQVRARDERLGSGPWSLPPAYLRQAQQAGDLRLLGRQRDGGRVVQLLSFSGFSPLGLPPDAPGATAERVTVLLALDSEDGLLRSATELAGPAGAAQTGRVTWRLAEEQWITGLQQSHEAFEVERAWTGIGNFRELPPSPSADPAMPLVAARAVGDPAALFSLGRLPFWLPARPPPGVDRAMLIWDGRARQDGHPPSGLVYLGEGRRLVLAFNSSTNLAGERFAVGPWRVTLQAGRGQRYTAALARPEAAPELSRWGLFDPSGLMLLDATGFTRAELEALVAGMAPFDLAALAAQDGLFLTPGVADPAARSALLAAAYAAADPPPAGVRRTTSRWYIRQAPGLEDPRRDPFHLPLYEGRPEVTRAEEWQARAGAGPALYVEVHDPAGGGPLTARYTDGDQLWRHLPRADALERWPPVLSPYTIRLPMAAATALDLLNQPGELSLERLPGGGGVVRHSESARSSPRYSQSVLSPSPAEPHLFDLQPLTMTTELELSPAGEAAAVRIYAGGRDGDGRTLVESYELVGRETLPLEEAPAPLRVRKAPEVAFAREFRLATTQAADILRRDALDQTLPLPGGQLYAPAEGAATLLSVDEGAVAPPGAYVDYGAVAGDPLREAVARRLAVSAAYRVPLGESTAEPFDVRITQGPAGRLGALLRASPAVPWDTSEPAVLVAAGVEREGWYGAGLRNYVIVELDGTLVILESPRPLDDPQLRALLAGLRPAR